MVIRPRLIPVLATIMLAAVAACGQGSASPGAPSSPAAPTEGVVPEDVPASLITAVIDDAAGRTGVAAADVVVTRAEAVTWNDGSLGCPEPDMGYTQALVEGYQVVVAAGGQELDYRAGEAGRFRLCEQPPE